MRLKSMAFIFLLQVLVPQKKNVASSTLTAMHVPEDVSTSAVRISLGDQNTLDEAKEFIKVFDQLYEEFDKLS